MDRIQTLLMIVPLAGLIAFGQRFFGLWMPYKDASEVRLLAYITTFKALEQFANVSTDAFQFNFTMYNRLKRPMLLKLAFSLCNIPLVILLVKLAGDWTIGVCIVAGLSTLLFMAYYFGVAPRLSAQLSGERVGAYYRCLGKLAALFAAMLGVYALLDRYAPRGGWGGFLLLILAAGALGYLLLFLLGTTRAEKQLLLDKVKGLKRC